MKKNVLFISATMMLALGITSCSKSYNCHCVYKDNGTVTHTDDHKISENKSDKAKASCDQEDNTTTSTVGGNTYVSTTECEIQ